MSVAIINPEIAEKGGRIAKALMEGGAAGWSTQIGKNVGYVIGETDFGVADEVVKPAETGEVIATAVDWSGDTSGKIYVLVPTMGAKQIVAYMMALMLGGDANPEAQALDADGMDAYGETIAAFIGQGAQQARGEIGGSIKTSVQGSSLVDFSSVKPDTVLGADEYLNNKIKVTIEGLTPFTMFILIGRSVTGVAPEAGSESAAPSELASRLGVDVANVAIAMKIKLPLVVVIATKKMRMELIQGMCPGTIIEFRKMSGENLDVLAGNVKVATAEAVIVNQCFGVQIRNIVDPKSAVKEATPVRNW